jgi:hypothetical protein
MASCPLMSLARGTSSIVPISLKKGNIVAPRISIGPAYAQPVEVVFSVGFEPPHWTFGSRIIAPLGWLFRDIQSRATPAAGASSADTSLNASVSVTCLEHVVIRTDRVTPSYVF